MPPCVAGNPPETASSTFSPSDYFLGIAQRITTSGRDTRVSLPGVGEVALFPARRMFSADLSDPEGFFQEPASQFHIAPIAAGTVPEQGRNIGELLWMAGFHASKGRMVEGTSIFDVVEFHHWPNLPRLPHTPNTARICAMLTRHPTTIMLAHRLLGIRRDEVYRVYSAAFAAGIANIVHQNPVATAPAKQEPEDNTEARGLFRSLLAKISGL